MVLSPMGRIRLDKIRRGELIDATLRAVAENGIAGATVAVIAGKADVSTGIVHHYFSDKGALLEAAMRSIRAPLPSLIRAVPGGGSGGDSRSRPEILQNMVRCFFHPRVFSSITTAAWTAFAAAAPHEPKFARVRAAQRARTAGNFAYALHGLTPEPWRRWHADLLTTGIDGAWFNAATVEGAADGDRALAMLEPLLHYVLSPATDA